MDLDNLLKLRNFSMSYEGKLLYCYICDFITSESLKNVDANEIKGMCKLFEKIKRIPDEVQKIGA